MEIHLVKTRLANAILAVYSDKILVIDVATGCDRQVLGYIEETLGRSIGDITLVTCTHDDPDHMGGIKELGELADAPVAVPYASGDIMHKMLNDPFGGFMRATTGMREAFRGRTWAMYASPKRNAAARQSARYEGDPVGELSKATPVGTRRLKDGERLPGFDDWQILHTPGHSWDSCCFFHAETASLVSGDTLLGSRKRGGVVLPAIYANRVHFSATLKNLKQMDIRAVYPGHGMVITGTGLLEDLA